MTDHDAEIATLHQENTQLRARVKRLEAALRYVATAGVLLEDAFEKALDALQEHSE